MPLYEYKCVKCGRKTEKIEGVSGPHLKKCPHCGGKVEQQITAPAIQFKGSGWYVTDYAGKKGSSGGESSSEKAKTESKDSGSKDSGTKDASAKESSSKDKKASKEK